MQAIETRFYGPTNHRGARVKATCEAGTITVPWDDGLGVDENHDAAALALLRRLGWHDRVWYRGTTKGSRGNVYVCTTAGGMLPSGDVTQALAKPRWYVLRNSEGTILALYGAVAGARAIGRAREIQARTGCAVETVFVEGDRPSVGANLASGARILSTVH
jgi:hypothetical protein